MHYKACLRTFKYYAMLTVCVYITCNILFQSPMPANKVLPTVDESDLFSACQPVLAHIQMLWELVLTGEPLVVMATVPSVCAHTVQALVSMISPLKYCTDYRPYFTIHDTEFREYTTKTQAPPAVILGVTNPFFAKTLQHWPHVVRIGEQLYFFHLPWISPLLV